MSRKAKGSVTRHRDKWKARLGGVYLGVFDEEQEAWQVVNAALKLSGHKGRIPNTLRIVGDRWFREREADGIVRGVKREKSVWKMHIECASFIDHPIKDIKPKHIHKWLRELQKKNAQNARTTSKGIEYSDTNRKLSQQTVRHAFRILSGCFDWAVMEGRLTINPAYAVKVPKRISRTETEIISYLTEEEIANLFALDLDIKRRAVFSIAIYCGLRMGEIWGLRWSDIDLDGSRPMIRVRRSYDGPTKTTGSNRDVPLLRIPRELLREWKHAGGAIRGIGLVFPAKHGGCYRQGYDAGWTDRPQRRDGELKVTQGVRSRAGVRDHIRFHDLRHTCASHLVMGTWGRAFRLEEVKVWLGHSSIAVTERYAHLSPDSIHGAAKEMDK